MSHSSIFSEDQGESAIETAAEHRFDLDWTDLCAVRQTDSRPLRKSCDRCHQQKLRCVGDKSSLTRCMRCQRAGLECVYSARSSKQPNKNNNGPWESKRSQPMTPISNSLSELHKVFSTDLLDLNDIFPGLPSCWGSGEAASLASCTLPAFQSASTSEGSLSVGRPASNSPIDGHVGPIGGQSDLSGRLANVCQSLETTLAKVIRDHTKLETRDYPVGEVFGVFDVLLRVLALDDMVAISTSRKPQTPIDEYMRSKQASIAAQCYVLCIKLMGILSEQILQSLLALPVPTARPGSGGLSTSEATQSANALGIPGGLFSSTHQIPENLRLRDLYVPPDPFGYALHSAIPMLQIGNGLLGKMEQLLGIPPELGGGSTSSGASPEQAGLDQHALKDARSLRPSLPARFVALTWEDEAGITGKSAPMYFQRCRAAILGLSNHHS